MEPHSQAGENPEPDRQAILAAYLLDATASLRSIGKRFGRSHEWIRQIVDELVGPEEARAIRARVKEEAERERIYDEFRIRADRARPCKVCSAWVLRGNGKLVTCSAECAVIYTTSSARNYFNDAAWTNHRDAQARYWLRNGTPEQKVFATNYLAGRVKPNGRWYLPGSKASETVKRIAPERLPRAAGGPSPPREANAMPTPQNNGTRTLGAGIAPRQPIPLRTAVDAGVRRLLSTRSREFDDQIERMKRFAAFTKANGVEFVDSVTDDDVRRFIDCPRSSGAPPTDFERGERLAAVRMLFRDLLKLGLAVCDPTRGISLGASARTLVRPLDDHEIAVGEMYTFHPFLMRPAVCWALAEATALPSEVIHVTSLDVDLDRGAVFLHGGANTDARWGKLTSWGEAQIRRAIVATSNGTDPGRLLIGMASSDDPDARRTAASMALAATLRAAGLTARDVKPDSIRAWAGANALAAGATIDTVARMLGVRSLDQAAAIIGFVWRGARA